MRNFEGEWGKSAEGPMVRIDEMSAGKEERMVGVQTYVKEAVVDESLVTTLISQKFAEKIGDDDEKARRFAKNNPFYIPSDVRADGEEYEIAFVLALAEELSKPEYNQ